MYLNVFLFLFYSSAISREIQLYTFVSWLSSECGNNVSVATLISLTWNLGIRWKQSWRDIHCAASKVLYILTQVSLFPGLFPRENKNPVFRHSYYLVLYEMYTSNTQKQYKCYVSLYLNLKVWRFENLHMITRFSRWFWLKKIIFDVTKMLTSTKTKHYYWSYKVETTFKVLLSETLSLHNLTTRVLLRQVFLWNGKLYFYWVVLTNSDI